MYHLIYPAVGTILYLSYPKSLRLPPTFVKYFSILHNVFLALFSGYSFLKTISIIYTHGIVFQDNYYFSIPEFDTIQYYFYLSKYYEYIDTFLIYLKGKKPIFLQTYHHIGAVLCWHFTYHYKVDAVIIPSTFNMLVHTVMYSYYALTLLKINVSFIKMYITTLQLIQFFVCNMASIYLYYPVLPTFKMNIIWGFFTYAVGLIILFSNFFYKTYFTKKDISKRLV